MTFSLLLLGKISEWKETLNTGIDGLRLRLTSSLTVNIFTGCYEQGTGAHGRCGAEAPNCHELAVVPQDPSLGQNTTQVTCSPRVHIATTAIAGIGKIWSCLIPRYRLNYL